MKQLGFKSCDLGYQLSCPLSLALEMVGYCLKLLKYYLSLACMFFSIYIINNQKHNQPIGDLFLTPIIQDILPNLSSSHLSPYRLSLEILFFQGYIFHSSSPYVVIITLSVYKKSIRNYFYVFLLFF